MGSKQGEKQEVRSPIVTFTRVFWAYFEFHSGCERHDAGHTFCHHPIANDLNRVEGQSMVALDALASCSQALLGLRNSLA
ncbi:hypothetical protein SPZE110945_16170 [Sphingomonas zeae]